MGGKEDGKKVLGGGTRLGAVVVCLSLATGHLGELSLRQGHDQNGPPSSSPSPFFSPLSFVRPTLSFPYVFHLLYTQPLFSSLQR